MDVLYINSEVGEVSDGYHTFNDLYSHRITLYIQLCKVLSKFCTQYQVWRSKSHSDGTSLDGWFLLGINKNPREQITYHLPMNRWNDTYFAETLYQAPEFDGHTSQDVLLRLENLTF